ncbi:MAG TPA: Crp/Fnr family transcriptional regulator [Thermohalobaculum sp.]|nr:Crp/Fnr family transcriptional regulator [Thermohalobaculum sp.]
MARNHHRTPFDPEGFIAKVGIGRSSKDWAGDQTIFTQGDAADAVFYIHRGQVKLSVVSEQGKEAIVAVLGPDEFFGEACLAGQSRRLATATTMTECDLVRLERTAILKLLQDEPAFAETFITHILARTIRVEADLVDQLFNSSEKRLARALLLLANFGKDDEEPEKIITQISQESLAEMIGTTRSRVSYFMNKFRKLGFIEYNGGIRVHSSLLNVVLNKPDAKSRTMLGIGAAGLATVGIAGVEVTQRALGQTQVAVGPLVPYLDTLRWVLIGVALAGFGIALYAHWGDWRRGRR